MLDQVGAEWYVMRSAWDGVCPGYVFGETAVPYLTHRAAFERWDAEGFASVPAAVMIWNEADNEHFMTITLDEMVEVSTPFVAWAVQNGVVLVGPCPAQDVGQWADFWAAFERINGWLPELGGRRLCMHCYLDNAQCLAIVEQNIEQAIAAGWPYDPITGRPYGGAPLWWAEYGDRVEPGKPLDAALEVDKQHLVNVLACPPASYWVGRVAHWPLAYRGCGVAAPCANRYSQWVSAYDLWYGDWGQEPTGWVEVPEVVAMYRTWSPWLDPRPCQFVPVP